MTLNFKRMQFLHSGMGGVEELEDEEDDEGNWWYKHFRDSISFAYKYVKSIEHKLK